MSKYSEHRLFPNAEEDALAARLCIKSMQTESPAYRLAYLDQDFLLRDELRPLRLQLELLKPELMQQESGIEHTVVVFGSARIVEPVKAGKGYEKARLDLDKDPSNPALQTEAAKAKRALDNARYYDEARRFALLLSQGCQTENGCKLVIITGGGPGIMEAANRGAADVGAQSIGLNIVLPMEQEPNPYITPELCFQFHYFAIRKMHFLMRAKALVAFPGGFGTFDELFETLTLIQTKKIRAVPILLFGRAYWQRVINFDAMVEEGMIAAADLELFRYVETAEEASDAVYEFYSKNNTS